MTDRLVSTMKRTLASFLSSSSATGSSFASEREEEDENELSAPPRKRLKRDCLESPSEDTPSDRRQTEPKRSLGVGTPPLLVSPAPVDSYALAELLQKKRYSGRFANVACPIQEDDEEDRKVTPLDDEEPLLLLHLPTEVISDGILSFLSTTADRFALQTSCKLLRNLSNSPNLLRTLHLFGQDSSSSTMASSTGTGSDDQHHHTAAMSSSHFGTGLIADLDTPDSACAKLVKYARAGNHQAIYMLGMIRSYCHGLVEQGASLLKLNSTLGCPRSLYALALILRDSRRNESRSYLSLAAAEGYLPAWQELLPAPEMKAKYGDLDAHVLRSYLDPPCLNKLLGRHYLYCKSVRGVQTSHCWNPLCGRWAYKATAREPPPTMAAAPPVNPLTLLDSSSPSHSAEASFPFSETAQHVEALMCQNTTTALPSSDTLSCMQSPTTQFCTTTTTSQSPSPKLRVSRMKMCSQCRRAKYCSKLCQVYDWRSGKHKMECQYLRHA
mmetsp:Transcript_3127/g.4777  ORF Transcript_3127/g.4777 Transcript_3127/m.4777 type:complete len:497 (+) Transcript_3127:140-1630(+)